MYDLTKKQEVCSFGAREKNALKMKKQTLELSQDQIIAALSLMQERGFDRSSLLKMTLEAMMRAERDVHNEEECDLGKGYRPRRAFARRRDREVFMLNKQLLGMMLVSTADSHPRIQLN